MEYVTGETLDDLIRRKGAMPTDHAISLFCQVLEGMARAHKLVIIHRDIKPANMMLTEDGSIKVMDFGIARVLGTARMTRQGNIVGTIEYMSPEAIQGADVDARTDIYSLGILLYEMLTGRVPFVNDTEYSLMMAQINEPPPMPRTFAPHIPIHIEQAIMRALAKRPEDRFQSVRDFRRALEQNVSVPSPAAGTSRPGPTRVATGGPPVNAAGIGVKETRLGGAASSAMGGARIQAPPPTRLTDSEVSRSTGPGLTEYGAQRVATSGSFLDRLSWMHYAGAAVVLFVVVGVLVVLIAGFIWTRPGVQTEGPAPAKPAADIPSSAGVQSGQPQEKPSEQPAASPETPKVGSISPIVVPPQKTGSSNERTSGTTTSRPAQKKVDPAAAERARRAAEARRLLRQQ